MALAVDTTPVEEDRDNVPDAGEIRWRYKHIAVFLALIVIGLVLQDAALDVRAAHPRSGAFLEQLSTIILISGLWSGIYEFLLRREFLGINKRNSERVIDSTRNVERLISLSSGDLSATIRSTSGQLAEVIKIARKEERMGLVEVRSDSQGYDFAPLLLRSQQLVLVLNDEWEWISHNRFSLQERFQDPGKTTTVFFLNPQSPMLAVHAKKIKANNEILQRKIYETVGELRKLCLVGTQLRVLGHFLYNSYSLFLGDTYAVVTPYFNSATRRPLPLFRFEDREGPCFFKRLREDVQALEGDSAALDENQEFRRP